MISQHTMEAGIGLGLAFADFIIKYGKKFLKRNWGQFRVSCIDELSVVHPDSREILVDFLSRNDAYKMMKNLTNGSESDFKNLLNAFQDACRGTNHEFDPEEVITEIKHGVEITEAETSFEKIVTRYLQKFSESGKKIDTIHKTVKKISDKQDQTIEKNMNESSKPFSAESDIYSSYVEELASKLSSQPETRFNISFKRYDGTEESMEKLADLIKSQRKIILKGPAGGGKSVVVTDLVNNLIEKKVLPVMIELGLDGDFSKQIKDSDPSKVESQMDILLKLSKGTTNIEHLKNFDGEVWIVVDGLNEIAAGDFGQETVRNILDIVAEYARKTAPKTYVLVADRLTTRSFGQNWHVATLNPLTEQEIRSQLDAKIGAGKYELSDTNISLLSKPFFLNIALGKESASLVSESSALHDFFTEQLGLVNEELERLSSAAFETRKKHLSLSFDFDEFEKLATKETCEKLLDGGTITKTGKNNAKFDHQLMHDYLASNHLATNSERWNMESFDIATLESNSIEPIYLTLQQISETELADKFLLAVFDWNWNVAVMSMTMNSKLEINNHSEELSIAMLALVAQKQFDRVYGTSLSAKISLLGYDSTLAKQFTDAKDLKDLIKIIIGIEPKSELFKQWKNLFTADRDSKISEETINLIQSSNSLIGWTASNVLRECNLDESNQALLRTILKSSNSNDPIQNTRRWRVIHTLGRFPSENTAKLLVDALEKDDYHWVRYGAARALIEMAAVTENEDLRKHILGMLSGSLGNLKRNVLEEIGKAVFYRDAFGSWDDDAIALLEKIKGLQKSDQYTEKWENIINEYKEKKWKSST